MSKNFDETVRLQSEKREEWIREIRGERLQGIAKGASSEPIWLAHQPRFPRLKRVSGDPCSLIVQGREKTVSARSSREIEEKGKMEEKIGW